MVHPYIMDIHVEKFCSYKSYRNVTKIHSADHKFALTESLDTY